jgi:uncharacterized protein with HEPN domain
MRPEQLYLTDILDAADAFRRFCEPVGEDEFLQDEMRQSAVLQKLIVIGEAAAHLSQEFRVSHPDIEWEDIVGFRNIAVHQYFAVMWSIVWTTATRDVPNLQMEVSRILTDEFREH